MPLAPGGGIPYDCGRIGQDRGAIRPAGLGPAGRRLGLWALRVDYGLSWDEIAALACELPVVLNASTTPPEQAARIARSSPLAMALHNFYPRPETGAG